LQNFQKSSESLVCFAIILAIFPLIQVFLSKSTVRLLRLTKWLVFFGLPFVWGLILFASWWIHKTSSWHIFSSLDNLPLHNVWMVFGTSKYTPDGRQNLYFLYRINAVLSLRKAKKITYILVSGDNWRQWYNEPEMFRDALVEQWIPANRIVLDYAGFSTLDSVVRANKVFNVSSMLVISQEWQVRRAITICQAYTIVCDAYLAQDLPISWSLRIHLREVLARVKVLGDLYIWHAKPTYLGEKESVPWE